MCLIEDICLMCFDLISMMCQSVAEAWMDFWSWCRRTWSGFSMTTRRKIVVLTILISIPALAAAYFGLISVRLTNDQALRHSVDLLKHRIKFLESEFVKQEQLLNQENDDKSIDVNNETFTPELEAYLRNISGTHTEKTAHGSQPIHIMRFDLPADLEDEFMPNVSKLRPGFSLVGQQRPYVQTVIGIPTVSRPKESYLKTTVKHLINGLTIEQKQNTIILIYIGETDLEFVVRAAYEIEKEFPDDLESGLIEIISPGRDYYPDFNKIPPSLGDSQKRTNWRTKQNLDAIFLMSYARRRCQYYLMIEDDVIAVNGFMTEIEQYTDKMTASRPDWFFIQFSTTGGIGKLFRTKTLLRFTAYLQLFYANMPIDWLLESYLADRNCGIGKSSKQCGEAKELIRPTYKKNLFQHIGRYSSLKGKIQKVKSYIHHDLHALVQEVKLQNENLLRNARKFFFIFRSDPFLSPGKDTSIPRYKFRRLPYTFRQNLTRYIGKKHYRKYPPRDRDEMLALILKTIKENDVKSLQKKLHSREKRDTVLDEGAPADDLFETDVHHNNPPLKKIKCTLAAESGHAVEAAYNGDSFAWLHQAKKDDVIEFWFKKPTEITGYKIFTASAHHMKDKLYKAVLEAKPYTASSDFVEVDKPDEFGMFDKEMPTDMGVIEAIRIRFTEPSQYWLLITEIYFDEKT